MQATGEKYAQKMDEVKLIPAPIQPRGPTPVYLISKLSLRFFSFNKCANKRQVPCDAIGRMPLSTSDPRFIQEWHDPGYG